MIVSIGWKNIWRNKTRSLVVIIAIMLGIFGGVLASGIMKGWMEQRIHSSIHNEIAHVQIHDSAYMENEEIINTIKDFEKVADVLDSAEGVSAWSPRAKVFAMARTSSAVSGFMIRGVDPEKEKQVSEIYKYIVSGTFLEGDPSVPSVVIGSKAAENLKLVNYEITDEKLKAIDRDKYDDELVDKLRKANRKSFERKKEFLLELGKVFSEEELEEYGEKLAKYFVNYKLNRKVFISLPDTETGQSMAWKFKVRGIFETDNSMWDGMNAFIDREVMNSLTNLAENEVHEIAIISTDNEAGDELAERLKKYLPEQHIQSWREASPDIAMYNDYSNIMAYVFVGFILFALAFGIINTMMMSVLERVKELGMLMAIGMNKKRVFSMIMVESVFLTLTGAIAGMILSGVVLTILGNTGLNFDMFSEGFEAMGYGTLVYPRISLMNYLGITSLTIITGIISAIWPARKALKLNPVEALRTE